MTDNEPDAIETFIPVADYAGPPMPAEEYLRRLIGRIRALIVRHQPKPFIADEKLKRATLDMLDEVVAPPACGALLKELDRTVLDWLAENPRVNWIKVIVVPPCDENAMVKSWAEQAGHEILQPPPRDRLIDVPPAPLPSLDGEGLLVVPRLEQWFLRHRNGLRLVRSLLAALDTCKRPVVIGCNSWAWQFLAVAVAADQLLPDAVTFVAFDEMRLHRWFTELSEADTTASVQFRRSTSGADVLELGDDGKPKDDFLGGLAGRSLGIPWVAWHLWRRSLRSDIEDKIDADAPASSEPAESSDEQTLWVTALDELVLPGTHPQSALLVMQALLIHGDLSAAQLRLVLPLVGESNIVPVLVKSGFIARNGDLFACRAAAYPVIRAGLKTAGLPLDRI